MIKVLELFGGIGAMRRAMENIQLDFSVVDYVEYDKKAALSYNAIFNESYDIQDIYGWNKDIDIDLIFHGSPCQNFSKEGNNKGGVKGSNTKSSAMWETVRIVEKLKPQTVIWENVASVKSYSEYEDYKTELSLLEYYHTELLLNTKDFGIPQHRRRVFIISTLNKVDLTEDKLQKEYTNDVSKILLNLENPEIFNDKYRLTMPLHKSRKMLIRTATKQGFNICEPGDIVDLAFPNSKLRRARVIKDRSCPTITTGKVLGVVMNNEDLNIRYITAHESLLFQGYTTEDYEKMIIANNGSKNAIQKQAGNSISIPVLESIFKELFKEYLPIK